MWELQIANPFASLSMRKLLTFVAATLVTIFSYLLLTSPTAYAIDATWDQGSIVYNGNTYRGPTEPTADQNLPDGSVVYTYLPNGSQTMDVIYFPPGADTSNAQNATHISYDRGPTGGLTNPSTTSPVTIDQTTLDESQQAADPGTSSCKIDGIGWIICPVTNFLASGMDWIFNIISGFLKTRPLDTLTSSTMYRAWEVMRNFANVVFVIAFLIIIYSQLTSFGLSNYGVKKMIPRLIVAAILVNVSYWICAVAIDVSNILGFSLQGLFIGLRNSIMGNNANSWDLVSWESITAFILSGGAAAGAAIAGVAVLTTTLAGSFAVGGVALVLVPILLGAFLTVLVVLFILAARQALITLLVVVAPLAFVAYILPNTEKWFEKWRSLFMTMLIMFPAFSVIFGGAQLAGILIIQNAQDINVVLLGMAVQIAPLAITPLLFKLSGSLLGRIAGIINNPSKGVLDRTKNWSKDRLDARRADQMRKNRAMDNAGQLGKARHFARRAALRYDTQKRLREGKKAYDESDANALFQDSAAGRQLHEAQFTSNNLKERIETNVNVSLKERLNSEGSQLHTNNLNLELAKDRLKDQDQTTQTQLANYRTEEYLKKHLNPVFGNETIQTIAGLRHFEEKVALGGMEAQGAKITQARELTQALERSATLRAQAAGIDNENGRGETRILSEVISKLEAEKDTLVKNIKVASDVRPGDAQGLAAKFKEAVQRQNAEGVRAYADLLVESANPGVIALRNTLSETEGQMSAEVIADLKAHINSSGPINAAAEDIATWSRDKNSRQLIDITHDKKTWEGLTANAFAGEKKSSQEAALFAGAVSRETATAILKGPARQNLKPDMLERIERLSKGQSTYTGEVIINGERLSGPIQDPFQ
jgi:hypothetical protein